MLAIAPSANPALGTAPSPCARLHAVPKIRPMELYGQCYALDESEAKGALRDGKTSVSKYASSKLLVHRPCAARLTTGAALVVVDASTQRDELPSVP